MGKICTDIKQSRKLIELGLDTKTADMFWDLMDGDEPEDKIPSCRPDRFDIEEGEFVPAWSLTALLGLMPQTIDEEDKWLLHLERCYHRTIPRFICRYPNIRSTEVCDSPIDAAFEMMCWLLENGHIRTKKEE